MAKNKELRREYKRVSELELHIYWMDLGREGAHKFEAMAKQKKLAVNLAASIGISEDKALKMIRKSEEAQEKADSSRSRNRGRSRGKGGRGNRRRSGRGRGRGRGRGNHGNAGRGNAGRGNGAGGQQ